ncbi:hypothetical protein KA977_03965 [Candidatus Dependentiae bacterium]|nr:hypothetical protein [Candidatus Dependentiae bacterium]
MEKKLFKYNNTILYQAKNSIVNNEINLDELYIMTNVENAKKPKIFS